MKNTAIILSAICSITTPGYAPQKLTIRPPARPSRTITPTPLPSPIAAEIAQQIKQRNDVFEIQLNRKSNTVLAVTALFLLATIAICGYTYRCSGAEDAISILIPCAAFDCVAVHLIGERILFR